MLANLPLEIPELKIISKHIKSNTALVLKNYIQNILLQKVICTIDLEILIDSKKYKGDIAAKRPTKRISRVTFIASDQSNGVSKLWYLGIPQNKKHIDCAWTTD